MGAGQGGGQDDLLQRVLDGGMSGAEEAQARRALEADPARGGALAAHQALQRELRALRGAEPGAGFEDRVMGRVAQAAPEPWWRLAWRGLWVPVGVAVAAAAVAVVVLVDGTVGSPGGGGVAASTMAPGVVRHHRVTARLRAGAEQWPAVRAALAKAGVAVAESPRQEGGFLVERVEAAGEAVREAVRRLGALMPVDVSGEVPAGSWGGGTVTLEVVLTGF
jgi:anti-sigma factor RsiW